MKHHPYCNRHHLTLFTLVTAFLVHLFCLSISLAAPLPSDLPAKSTKPVALATLLFSTPISLISEVMRRDTLLATALQAQGKHLEIQSFPKGQDMAPAMKKGGIDFALLGDLPALSMAAESEIIIAGLAKLGSGGVVSRNSYDTLPDLRGKRIGVAEGSNVYYGLLIALEAAGMQEGDVKIIFMEPSELLPSLLKKEIEAMSIWPPILDSALHDHAELIVLQRFMNSSYIILRRSFADQQPEVTSLVLAAYLRALRWMKDDRQHLLLAAGWAKEKAENFQTEPFSSLDVICATAERDLLVYAANPSIPRVDREEGGQLHKLVSFLQKKGKLPASASWPRIQQSLDRHLLREILAQPDKHFLNTYNYSQGN